MSSKHPRLRGKAQAPKSLYPLGEFPDDVVIGIGKQIVHRLAIGQANIDGEDFGGIFATALHEADGGLLASNFVCVKYIIPINRRKFNPLL